MGPTFLAAAVLLAAQSAPASVAETGPVPAPVPLGNPGGWVGQMDYPPAALRAGAEGRVRFELDVDARGAVTACRVTESSASAELDGATCAALQRRARFTPARDAKGDPVAGKWSSAVVWKIPPAMPRPFVESDLVVSWVIEADGSTSDCRLERKIGETPPIDFCASIARQTFVPLRGPDGQPAAKRVRQSMSRTID